MMITTGIPHTDLAVRPADHYTGQFDANITQILPTDKRLGEESEDYMTCL